MVDERTTEAINGLESSEDDESSIGSEHSDSEYYDSDSDSKVVSVEEVSDQDDPLIKIIKERQSQQPDKPQPITSEDPFINLCFHPSEDIICMGCVSGNICIYSYGIEENLLKGEIEVHLKSCRAVEFSEDGKTLFSVGRDKMIAFVDMNIFDMKRFIDRAHNASISALGIIDENVIVTGDEEGVLKIWDTRYVNKHIYMNREITDYISDFTIKNSCKIACSSGDGTLSSFDMRSSKKVNQTEPYSSDLTSCCSTHNETMIVCGTYKGEFLFYKWDDFSELAGSFKPTRKKNIYSLLPISENLVLAGMEDGNIRSYHFFPHKEVGIVGQHTLNVEYLDISHDGSLIASLSPDPVIKFWNISYLEDFILNVKAKKPPKDEPNLPSSEFEDRKCFFSDLG